MKLLDRYVISSMLTSYAICIGIALSFYTIIDLFAQFYRFADYVGTMKEAGGAGQSLLGVVARYYYYLTPVILHHLIPMINLMAAMFTVTGMARANELVPLKSCGIAVYRLFLPLFAVSLLSSAGMVALQEWVIPGFAEKIDAMKGITLERDLEVRNSLYCDEKQRTFFVGIYYPYSGELRKIRMIEPYPDFRPKVIIEADRGKWGKSVSGKHSLILHDGKKAIYDTAGVLVRSGTLPDVYCVETDMDHRHLAYPEERHLDTLSTTALADLAREKPNLSQARVMYHSRFSFPLSTVVLLFLGVPWILRHHTRNLFVGSAICVIVSGAFYGVFIVCNNLGYKDILDPIFAAWFPTILFLSLGMSFLPVIHT